MNSLEVTRRKDKIDALFEKIAALDYDAEMQAHWTRYLYVLVAGFLEHSVRTIYGEYAERSAVVTSRYVRTQFDWFRNAKMQKMYELTGSFNDDWRKRLQSDTEGRLKDSVDSIVANRHNIAHGRDVSLSFVDLRNYYRDAIRVIEIVDSYCHE